MATFLELVNDLERESGTIQKGSRLATVVNAPNRQEKMVEWIIEAWRFIQASRADWPWMRKEFTSSLVIGQARYTATNLGLSDVSRWVRPANGFEPFTIYDPTIGQGEENDLRYTDWLTWRSIWDRGTHTPNRPIDISVDYDGKLTFGPTPDKTYTVRGEYYRTPQVLAANTDVPICPVEHHSAILWRAMMLLGDHDEAPAVVSTASVKFQRAYRDLVDAAMPEVSV
jgi:hypothetical protein